MPRKKKTNAPVRAPGRPAKYNWKHLLNGDRHLLRAGEDFQCSVDSFRVQVYHQAREAGVKVSLRRQPEEGTFLLEARRDEPTDGKHEKYDWDKLLDGEVHQLIAGKDFTSKLSSFRVYARQVAGERGVKITMKTMGNAVFLQAIKPKFDLSDLPFEMEMP